MIHNILKRDGTIVPFDGEKITQALRNAFIATQENIDENNIQTITDLIIVNIESEYSTSPDTPSVEYIQDVTEQILMQEEHFEVAKKYIVYREEHTRIRQERYNELIQKFEKKSLKVTKAGGGVEVFNLKKIKTVFDRACSGYEKKCEFEEFVDAFKKNIVPDVHTKDINRFMVKTAIDLVSVTNTAWQHVAARIFLDNLYKQATKNRAISIKDIYTPDTYLSFFENYVKEGLYYKDFFVYYDKEDILRAGEYLSKEVDNSYEYTTVLSFANRYLLNPNGVIKELPQEMYMSVALFIALPEKKENRLKYALELYKYISGQYISLPTPTLLNARTNYHQLSSCFKLNIDDDLRAIYHGVENIAQISKFGGGVGVYLGHIRSSGATIRGVKGAAGGVSPWIKVINSTATAVNQLGARIGAVSVTLDIWHRDIFDFLNLQTETGDIRSKAFDIFPAISVPDIFMRRVKEDTQWTLFDPHEVLTLYGVRLEDYFGKDFDNFYIKLENDSRLENKKNVGAKELFITFLKTVVETGMPYVFFRDLVNQKNPNAHAGNIYSTQLCTEICQNTSPTTFVEETLEEGKVVLEYTPGDTVVCNLASINVTKVHEEKIMEKVFPIVARALDNVITLNYYPIKEAQRTALRYRAVGLGYLGLAEYLATRHLAYESIEARNDVDALFERFAYHTYSASVALAKERGAYPLFKGSEYSRGSVLGRKKAWFEKNTQRGKEWGELLEEMKEYGVRFGYHSAPAPNTSTAGVVGTTAALLPIYKRYFVETNLSAPTVRVAPKLNFKNFEYYKEYISMDMKDVIDMIATIHPWIDQSISFEWMINPARTSPSQLFDFYFYAWKKGIKTVYYVRSLSAEIPNTCEGCSG